MFENLDCYDIVICLSIVICTSYIIYYIIKQTHHTVYYPVKLTVEQTILRIPVEDRVDLAIDDKHNVHNVTIKRNARQVIHQLQNSDQHQYTIASTLATINELIELSPDPNLDKLDAAVQALRRLEQINAFYHSANIAELEILRLVWERINHPINAERIEQLKLNIIEQLSDCVNGYSGVHCCEGRIMRILQTLEGCDQNDLVTLRPMWAYKEEISNKITQYRQKLLDRVSQKYVDLETKTDLNDNDRQLLDQFNQCLIKNLNKRFEIDYISKDLLTRDELEDLTEVYYESLYDY